MNRVDQKETQATVNLPLLLAGERSWNATIEAGKNKRRRHQTRHWGSTEFAKV